jgi:hypothetical protein
LGSVYIVQQQSTRQANKQRVSIRPRYLKLCIVLFWYKILLFVDKSICECAQLKDFFLNFTNMLNIEELLFFFFYVWRNQQLVGHVAVLSNCYHYNLQVCPRGPIRGTHCKSGGKLNSKPHGTSFSRHLPIELPPLGGDPERNVFLV